MIRVCTHTIVYSRTIPFPHATESPHCLQPIHHLQILENNTRPVPGNVGSDVVESRYNVPRLRRIHRYDMLSPRSRFLVTENCRSGHNVLSLQRTSFRPTWEYVVTLGCISGFERKWNNLYYDFSRHFPNSSYHCCREQTHRSIVISMYS